MIIPQRLTLAELQNSFRDVYAKFDTILLRNFDMTGRRVVNAGRSISDGDYVTRGELQDSTTANPIAEQITGMLNASKTVRFGTFATRGAPISHANELFYATDLDYIGWLSTGSAWTYVSGTRIIAQSAITTFTANLGTHDVGVTVRVTDFTHTLRWTGSALQFDESDPGSGQIAFFPIAPTGGTWGLCDGTAYTYLKADGTTASFTTPDYSTAAYIKAGTSATIGPTAASGVVSSENSHTHAVDPPSTTSGAPSATTTVDNDGGGSTVAVGSNTHTHTTDIASFSSGAGSPHDHGPNTLELRRSQLTAYFRR